MHSRGREAIALSMDLAAICSVNQSCLTLWDAVECSTSGFPVHHQLLELAQTHFHQVGDAIQPSHRRLSVKVAFSSQQGLIKALFFVVFQILT